MLAGSAATVPGHAIRQSSRAIMFVAAQLNTGIHRTVKYHHVDAGAADALIKAAALVLRVLPDSVDAGFLTIAGDKFSERGATQLAIAAHEYVALLMLNLPNKTGTLPANDMRESWDVISSAVHEELRWHRADDATPQPHRSEPLQFVQLRLDRNVVANAPPLQTDRPVEQRLHPAVFEALNNAMQRVYSQTGSGASSNGGAANATDSAFASRRYCVRVPHHPGARFDIPTVPLASDVLPRGEAARAAMAAHQYRCSEPGVSTTGCGGALVASYRAAEAAASPFREAHAQKQQLPCSCSVHGNAEASNLELELCASDELALPVSGGGVFASTGVYASVQASELHSCAPYTCAATEYADAGTSAAWETGLQLSDFRPLVADQITLPQALFLARRAEALTHSWVQSRAGPSRAAVYAGTTPINTLLEACGCREVMGAVL
jgi:hypothetical protein